MDESSSTNISQQGLQALRRDTQALLRTTQALLRDLLALGVRPGGVLLVHSSLRSLGPQFSRSNQGAEMAVQALLEVLGPSGTLLMPALSYETVNRDNPRFDVRGTPACIGALQEYFRTRPGTLRSVHPTHSVCAVGRQAGELLSDHHLDTTPCGARSPFAKLPRTGGQILFIGCGLRPNTSMHAVEEHVEPPYLYGGLVDYQVTLADGSQASMTVRRHNFKGWAQRYDRLAEVQKHGLAKGPVLQAECWLVEAAEMERAALGALRGDPLFFVEREQ
jgi:aminoglycoside 3-N-acetyltransferase